MKLRRNQHGRSYLDIFNKTTAKLQSGSNFFIQSGDWRTLTSYVMFTIHFRSFCVLGGL